MYMTHWVVCDQVSCCKPWQGYLSPKVALQLVALREHQKVLPLLWLCCQVLCSEEHSSLRIYFAMAESYPLLTQKRKQPIATWKWSWAFKIWPLYVWGKSSRLWSVGALSWITWIGWTDDNMRSARIGYIYTCTPRIGLFFRPYIYVYTKNSII